jgi:hypothetical protein
MKRMNVLAMAVALGLCTLAAAAVPDPQWQKVQEALARGLPRSAIEALEPIRRDALARGDHPEAVRAIVHRVALEGALQGSAPEEKIRRLQAEIAQAPPRARPILEAILARWYWQYFQRNRWRFVQRTSTAVSPGDDFTAWDLPRIYAEIDTHFTRALAAADLLKRTPVAAWDDVLERGTAPDLYRPTLYDFIAHEALAFYTSGEQAGARPEDAFEVPADSALFAPAAAFAAWAISAADSTAPAFRALRLYQELLRFHAGDRDPSARLDADLARLRFARNLAAGDGAESRHQEALWRLAGAHPGHEMSAQALAEWAARARAAGHLVAARSAAVRGCRRFPNSPGGRACWNLVQDIEAKSLSFETERVWNEPPPVIRVRYRNLDRVRFRVVPFDYRAWMASGGVGHELLVDRDLQALLRRRPTREWSVELTPTPDFAERVVALPAPDDLPPGSYHLIASADDEFRAGGDPVHVAVIWVSQLALVLRDEAGALGGFVLDAASGAPLAGARVRAWRRDRTAPSAARYAITDTAGRFRIPGVAGGQVVLATHADQRLGSFDPFWTAAPGRPDPFRRTLFFTDRALYRPGQTIRYKGLCIAVDQERDDYAVVAGKSLAVTLTDANGQEVARARHRTNDYGSFSGSFVIPQGRLLGAMTLRADSPPGAAVVSVEEYKRPKFSASFGPPSGTPRLGGEVTVPGRATAYTGAAVDGAAVTWHVTRSASYAPWWTWRGRGRNAGGGAKQVAHGRTVTGADGSFEITFPAAPDPAFDPQGHPVFVYTVHADVTSPAGETWSAERVVRVGTSGLAASLSADAWLESERSIRLTLRTATLDGAPRAARGSFTLHRLREPAAVPRPAPGAMDPADLRVRDDEFAADPATWPDDMLVREDTVATDTSGVANIAVVLVAGAYRAVFETTDGAGRSVRAELPLRVVDPLAPRCGLPVPFQLDAPAWSVEPGGEFLALWGSGHVDARAFVEIEHRGQVLQAGWTPFGRSQVLIRQKVTEEMRGGFTLRVLMVYENRAYVRQHVVDVPWTDRRLAIRWERFVSKLEPGRRAAWTAVVTGRDATAAVAEWAATLYDASLDAFRPHGWPDGFGVFRQEPPPRPMRFENSWIHLHHVGGGWPNERRNAAVTHRRFPDEWMVDGWRALSHLASRSMIRSKQAPRVETLNLPVDNLREVVVSAERAHFRGGRPGEFATLQKEPVAARATAPAPDAVNPRRHLAETAFFLPHLVSNARGEVRMEFAMPEALTRWRFLGFAHDSRLRAGRLEGEAVTALDLMVQPNPPRFLREGDEIEFTVQVTNLSSGLQQGRVRLTFADAGTGASRDAALANHEPERPFEVPPHESRTFAWRLVVPDGPGVLVYRAVASAARHSDGEEGALPVLSRSILVTESLPLPIRGPAARTFDFASLRAAGASPTLRHHSFTVQMVSNPSWYAVMALPYLMEYPHECSEQTFNRLYANALARHIVTSQPRIRRVFERWRGTPALDSPLERNQDLKAVMLEESPWLRQARAESQARRDVAVLFDDARLEAEIARAQRRLAELQLADGAWPWFPGGRANDYITLYVAAGFGRLRHLGVPVDVAPALRAVNQLDLWADRTWREALRAGTADGNQLSPAIALYLYGRSFFLPERPVPEAMRGAVDFWLGQARRHWLALPGRQSQAHVALALRRFGDEETARAIVRSLKERAVTDGEMGMFWREDERSWWWHRAPIETQAMMIEALHEVARDTAAVEDCKAWLLKQKQTRDWRTTKATADAVYALLLRGSDPLASEALVEVALGGEPVRADAVEAGTGFYERRFAAVEVRTAFADVAVRKSDPGVAWGSVHWQYFEDASRVRPYAGTPLTLRKDVFVRETGARGPVLRPVAGAVRVGDELVVRIELRADRDMEYVHLKDHRGSGVEPVNVLSGYRYQDGLRYYEQTRDAASHFFIDYLPRGTYVFEYPVRVQLRGRYPTGIAGIQCMYAPEFNSHSQGVMLEVR